MDQTNNNDNNNPKADTAVAGNNTGGANSLNNMLSLDQRENLFTQLGLNDLSDERKKEMMEVMGETILNRVFARISPLLSPEDQKSLDELDKQENADEKINQYLSEKIPNLDQITKEEIEKFREELKRSVTEVKQAFEKREAEQKVSPQSVKTEEDALKD